MLFVVFKTVKKPLEIKPSVIDGDLFVIQITSVHKYVADMEVITAHENFLATGNLRARSSKPIR